MKNFETRVTPKNSTYRQDDNDGDHHAQYTDNNLNEDSNDLGLTNAKIKNARVNT